jgi:4-amino-4-deoxy-L-arabinose transferase-like glycosyltransferase
VDQSVTVSLFLLNIVYVALGIWGAARLWRASAAVRPAITLIATFIVLRTAFLTTLETPEPRYVLVCFPALIALAAQILGRPSDAIPGADR